mgnify:CR=1 FL=1
MKSSKQVQDARTPHEMNNSKVNNNTRIKAVSNFCPNVPVAKTNCVPSSKDLDKDLRLLLENHNNKLKQRNLNKVK